jgi:hypothetical protein
LPPTPEKCQKWASVLNKHRGRCLSGIGKNGFLVDFGIKKRFLGQKNAQNPNKKGDFGHFGA